MHQITDTFPAFLKYWDRYSSQPVEKQLAGWRNEYLDLWPWLFQKQTDDYREQGEYWKDIAVERVFPFLSERLPGMISARRALNENIPELHSAAVKQFSIEMFDVHYVTYVGIGCGAGWVTTLGGKQAVLFGLEMAAECGWTDTDSIRGLIAHEIGHAVHGFLRNDYKLAGGSGPLWRLYIEGFADTCEKVLTSSVCFHEGTGLNPADWQNWCEENRGALAGRFLEEASAGGDCRDFFGSWYSIQGYRQCGYWLGHQVLKELTEGSSLKQLALVGDVNTLVGEVLRSFL